jgi:hypothetical protein
MYDGYPGELVILLSELNNPPNTPSNPSPANHAINTSIYVDLSWTGGDPDAGDTVTYDIYFGTSSSPPLVSNDQPGSTYDPGTLSYNTKYYWYVAATDNHGTGNGGPIWDFTTGPAANNPPNTPSNPSPANHATGLSINTDLSWTGGDPDAGDTVTYDVYFGTTSSPPLVSDNQAATTYDPGTLAYNTKYYWYIVATDNHDIAVEGSVWDFTTGKSGDVDGDGNVNVLDMIRIGQHWGETGSPGWIPEDVKPDGVINVLDMIIIGQHWTG